MNEYHVFVKNKYVINFYYIELNKYHVFVDESYDKTFFVLAIVWVKKINEVKRLKLNALNKIGKSRYNFHFKDDPQKIKDVFMEEILDSPINAG
ncbi:hypothetical protein WIW90_09145, partial [Sulfolobaceae archaeon RB850M]